MNLLLALVLAMQTTADPLLSRRVGQWSGTGTVLNQGTAKTAPGGRSVSRD